MTEPLQLKNRSCDQLREKAKQLAASRPLFNRNIRIATEHTARRATETSDGLRLALATPRPIAAMILDGLLNYERSNMNRKEIALEGKFVNFEYVDVIAATQRIETFAARLIVRELKQGKKKLLVVSFYPDREHQLDPSLLPEVRHEPWE